MENKPEVCVIIVTWNNKGIIAETLESLRSQDFKNFRTIVVDSASADGTVEFVRENFPEVEIIASDVNLYYGGGNNRGMEYASQKYSSEFFALLNSDAVVAPNWLSSQLEVIKSDGKIGMVGPKITFYANGLINSAGLVYDGYLQAYDRGFNEPDSGQFDQEMEVPAISGCSILLKSAVFKEVGGFWTRLRMYLEDVEFCIRVRESGWKIVYVPATTVRHKYMQSTNQNKNLQIDQMKKKNMLLIALRHYSIKSKLTALRDFLFA